MTTVRSGTDHSYYWVLLRGASEVAYSEKMVGGIFKPSVYWIRDSEKGIAFHAIGRENGHLRPEAQDKSIHLPTSNGGLNGGSCAVLF